MKKLFLFISLFACISASCQKGVLLDPGMIVGKRVDTPTVNAGNDQSLGSGATSTTLTGIASSPNGSITSYWWTKISGPSATITAPALASTGITGMSAGVYVFQLLVTDITGNTARDELIVLIPAEAGYSDTVFVYATLGQSNSRGVSCCGIPDSLPYREVNGQVRGVQIWNWVDNTIRPYEVDRYNGTQSPATPYWWGGDIVVKKVFDSTRGGFTAGADSVVHFKSNLGGSSLGPWTTSVGTWCIPQSDAPAGKQRMLDSTTRRWTAFKAYWNSRGYYVKVVAIMWHQGESDYANSATYAARQSQLFTHFRDTLFQTPNLPIVMGNIPVASANYNATIRAAQNSIAASDPYIWLVDLDGVPLYTGDDIHLIAISQIYFGNEMYKIIKTFAR